MDFVMALIFGLFHLLGRSADFWLVTGISSTMLAYVYSYIRVSYHTLYKYLLFYRSKWKWGRWKWKCRRATVDGWIWRGHKWRGTIFCNLGTFCLCTYCSTSTWWHGVSKKRTGEKKRKNVKISKLMKGDEQVTRHRKKIKMKGWMGAKMRKQHKQPSPTVINNKPN